MEGKHKYLRVKVKDAKGETKVIAFGEHTLVSSIYDVVQEEKCKIVSMDFVVTEDNTDESIFASRTASKRTIGRGANVFFE